MEASVRQRIGLLWHGQSGGSTTVVQVVSQDSDGLGVPTPHRCPVYSEVCLHSPKTKQTVKEHDIVLFLR